MLLLLGNIYLCSIYFLKNLDWKLFWNIKILRAENFKLPTDKLIGQETKKEVKSSTWIKVLYIVRI